MKHFKLLINSACCLLVACGCHKAATPKEASEAEYNNGDYHIRFTYPAAWHLMEDNDQDSLHVTLTAKAYSIEIYSRKSLDLMFGTMEDNFNNFMEFESQSSASYVFTGTKPSVLTNLPGYEFSFTMKQQQLEGVGFYTTKFNYNYAVLFQSDRITDQLYHQMLAFVTNMALTPPD
ncbi:MAG: hypothetical protein EOM20_18405, partial [Spartobacteria bacterium]|nr:hypothetical protein [Spartobacteria bacterium]